jgi:hypothetical protein
MSPGWAGRAGLLPAGRILAQQPVDDFGRVHCLGVLAGSDLAGAPGKARRRGGGGLLPPRHRRCAGAIALPSRLGHVGDGWSRLSTGGGGGRLRRNRRRMAARMLDRGPDGIRCASFEWRERRGTARSGRLQPGHPVPRGRIGGGRRGGHGPRRRLWPGIAMPGRFEEVPGEHQQQDEDRNVEGGPSPRSSDAALPCPRLRSRGP